MVLMPVERKYALAEGAQEGKKVVGNREDIWDLSRIVG